MTKPIISFVVLILSIGFGIFYVKPEYNLFQERKNDIASLSEILKNSNNIEPLINQTIENLKSIDSAGRSRFEVFLPQRVDPIRFANNLQHIGLANGIVLQNIKVTDASTDKQATGGSSGAFQGLVSTLSLGSKIEQAQGSVATNGGSTLPQKKYATVKAVFTLTTTYETFKLFLNDLEKSLGLINVTSLSFTPVQEPVDPKKTTANVPSHYQYTVEIETYSLK